MAKLRGPLFSLGASQQIGKALVFFPWKGLDVVREYVIPSNPKSAAQNTQRSYMTAAVATLHSYQGYPASFFWAGDVIAYALWASVVKTATTWFNQLVKNWIDRKVAGKIPAIFGNGLLTPGANKLTFQLGGLAESSAMTSGKIFYGTSKTALIYSVAATIAELIAGKDIPGLTKGVKYFVQFRPLLPATFVGNMSGIYYGVPT